MGFLSGGYQQSKSHQQQSSGLAPTQRDYFSNMAPSQFGYAQQQSQQAGADPAGLAFQGDVDKLMPMGPYGLPQSATQGVYQLGRDLFTQASGSRAQRGFRSPYNLEAVLGDSMRMASGQLIPQSTQVALQRAQMAPALRQASFGYNMTPMQTLQNLLASSSAGSGNSSSFGFNAAGGAK